MYCPEPHATRIAKYAAGTTEPQIAREEGVSQAAVSKSIRRALRQIREGLVRDGLLEME
jgi:hypothetical protein